MHNYRINCRKKVVFLDIARLELQLQYYHMNRHVIMRNWGGGGGGGGREEGEASGAMAPSVLGRGAEPPKISSLILQYRHSKLY